jgi:hypothetical protein
LAAFVLEHEGMGVDRLADVLGHAVDMYHALGLPNPAVTWVVNAALAKVGDVEAPRSWPKEHKARAAMLPLIVKRYVFQRDLETRREIIRSKQEAADCRKRILELENNEGAGAQNAD